VPESSYRIALLTTSLTVDGWVRDLANQVQDHPAIVLAAILVIPDKPANRPCTSAARLLLALEGRLLGRTEQVELQASDSVALLDISPQLTDLEQSMIRALDLDAIVDCRGEAVQGPIADAARDGIIGVQFGTGRLPGFTEVLEARPTTEFGITRWKSGMSQILARGSVTTQLFYSQNREVLFDRAAPRVLPAIEKLARGEMPAQSAPLQRTCATTGTATVLRYGTRTVGRVLQKAWRHATGREWNWGVAYSFAPWQRADLRSGIVLPKLPGTFLADPFVVEAGGTHYIFVEEFPYATRKAVISVFEVNEAGAKRLGVAVEEPFHLSFPFVFRDGERFYMVPEAQAGGELVLYECEEFPLKWTRKKVLLSGVCADTVIFRHGAMWWMLTSIKGPGRAENSAELYAFFADDLLGDWQEHRGNPILIDASKGRNGGLLKDDDGRIYRVAQRPGFRTYGDGSAIYRIDELTPDTYRETLVREVWPDFFPRLSGTHHMHSEAGLTVYDFSRDERP
jgi:hypothetical protein